MTEKKSVSIQHEAHVSANVKLIGEGGADIMLTVRNGATEAEVKETLDVLAAGLGYAKERYKLTPLGNGHNGPSSEPAAAQADGDPQKSGYCPVHGVEMRWRSKPGEPGWYSHKATDGQGHEFWCRGK